MAGKRRSLVSDDLPTESVIIVTLANGHHERLTLDHHGAVQWPDGRKTWCGRCGASWNPVKNHVEGGLLYIPWLTEEGAWVLEEFACSCLVGAVRRHYRGAILPEDCDGVPWHCSQRQYTWLHHSTVLPARRPPTYVAAAQAVPTYDGLLESAQLGILLRPGSSRRVPDRDTVKARRVLSILRDWASVQTHRGKPEEGVYQQLREQLLYSASQCDKRRKEDQTDPVERLTGTKDAGRIAAYLVDVGQQNGPEMRASARRAVARALRLSATPDVAIESVAWSIAQGATPDQLQDVSGRYLTIAGVGTRGGQIERPQANIRY